MRRNAAAVLLGGLLLLGPVLPAWAQETHTPSPLPPDPSAKLRKAIEQALADWFKSEPCLPPPARRTTADLKGERSRAFGVLEAAVKDWADANASGDAGRKGTDPLRKVPWWRSALSKILPQEAVPTGIKKQDITIGESQIRMSVVTSVPPGYRGRGEDTYPVILAIFEKDADGRKLVEAHYKDLLKSHFVVALPDDQVKGPLSVFFALAWTSLVHRVDRDRVVLDGHGRGARLVEEIAPELALQLQGVVFRSTTRAHPLAANLGLFPCWAFLRTPATEASQEAIDAIRGACPRATVKEVPGEPDAADLEALQAWVAALPPREVSDQSKPYHWSTLNLRGLGRWGYWIVAAEAVEEGPISISVARDPATNSVNIVARNLAAGSLLLNDEILDLEVPVKVKVNGIQVAAAVPTRSLGLTFSYVNGLAKDLLSGRDYFVTADLPFVVSGDARIPEAVRRAAEEAARKAKEDEERRAAEAEAAKAGGAEAGPTWRAGWDAASEAAAAEGRPIFATFDGPEGEPAQAAFDAAVARPDVRSRLAKFACVRLVAQGDGGKEALERLAKVSADAKPPHAVVWPGKDAPPVRVDGLALAEEEKIAEALKAMLDGVLPPPAPPAPPEGPAPAWHANLEAAQQTARQKSCPLFACFDAADDAPGQAAFDAALALPEVRERLLKAACVRLVAHGEDGKAALDRLAAIAKEAKPPHAVVWRTPDGAPEGMGVGNPGDAGEIARALVALLDRVLAPVPPPAPPPETPPAPSGPPPAEGGKSEEPAK